VSALPAPSTFGGVRLSLACFPQMMPFLALILIRRISNLVQTETHYTRTPEGGDKELPAKALAAGLVAWSAKAGHGLTAVSAIETANMTRWTKMSVEAGWTLYLNAFSSAPHETGSCCAYTGVGIGWLDLTRKIDLYEHVG
jgi:hypothetical protein